MSHKTESAPRLSTIAETAEALRLSTRTVKAMIAAGTIPSIKIGSRRLFNLPRVITHLESGVTYDGEAV